jgi:hypothetical protein
VASYSASIILSDFVFETGFLGCFTKLSFIAFRQHGGEEADDNDMGVG